MKRGTTLEFVGGVPKDVVEELAELVRGHQSLKAVLDWCLTQEPPILGTGVVTQDEFTHDLIVPARPGVFLVYDST
ncbi:MAG: hypothetical protein AAGK22_22160 [Acidobacteriota bacterium]